MSLPYPENEGQTHFEGCYRFPRHHNCAVQEVIRLEEERDNLKLALDVARRRIGELERKKED